MTNRRDFISMTAMTAGGWPKKNDDDNPIWEHSDSKNVAYFYTHKLFKKIVNETK